MFILNQIPRAVLRWLIAAFALWVIASAIHAQHTPQELLDEIGNTAFGTPIDPEQHGVELGAQLPDGSYRLLLLSRNTGDVLAEARWEQGARFGYGLNNLIEQYRPEDITALSLTMVAGRVAGVNGYKYLAAVLTSITLEGIGTRVAFGPIDAGEPSEMATLAHDLSIGPPDDGGGGGGCEGGVCGAGIFDPVDPNDCYCVVPDTSVRNLLETPGEAFPWNPRPTPPTRRVLKDGVIREEQVRRKHCIWSTCIAGQMFNITLGLATVSGAAALCLAAPPLLKLPCLVAVWSAGGTMLFAVFKTIISNCVNTCTWAFCNGVLYRSRNVIYGEEPGGREGIRTLRNARNSYIEARAVMEGIQRRISEVRRRLDEIAQLPPEEQRLFASERTQLLAELKHLDTQLDRAQLIQTTRRIELEAYYALYGERERRIHAIDRAVPPDVEPPSP